MRQYSATERYKQLNEIIARIKPRSIIEIGTHKGVRAAAMVYEALKYAKKVSYTGYDIFEHGGEQFQEDALNSKGMAKEMDALAALNGIAIRYPGRVDCNLVVGDTRQTLKGKHLKADFVFIDGDHRLATIKTDYEAVRMSHVVVLDDFYIDGGYEPPPDLSLYGCNGLVFDLVAEEVERGLNIRLLPYKYPSSLGGMIKMVSVERI